MSQSDFVKFPAAPALFEEHYPRIYRYTLSLMHDPAEADDAAQDTFVRAYRHLDSLRDVNALTTWLYRIATHVCLDRIRQQAHSLEIKPETDLDDLEEVDTPSLQQIVERNDMNACVQRYLDSLSDSFRAVILMHDLDGLTSPQIAAALGVSLATVKIRLHRARLRLRIQLEASCAFAHDERDVLVCEPKPDAQVQSLF